MIDVVWGALFNAWPTFLLFVVAVALVAWLAQERPSWHSLGAIAAFAVAIALMSLYDFWEVIAYPDPPTLEGVIAHYESLKAAYDVWGAGNQGSAFVYVILAGAFAFWPPKRGDFLLMGFLSVIVFAEGWTALMENVNCNFIQEDIPAELQTEAQANMSKCERIYGAWYRYAPIIAEIGIMAFFASCYKWATREVRKA